MPGYPDFRRQQDYDTFPAFVDQTIALRNTPITFGPFYVGLWHAMAGTLSVGLKPVRVTVEWFDTVTETRLLGTRKFVVDPNIPLECRWRQVNLGPYVKVTVDPVAVVNWTGDIVLWATNRVHPTEFPSRQPVAIGIANLNIGAGGNQVNFFEDYYAGPASIWAIASTVVGTVRLEVETDPGLWFIILQIPLAVNVGFFDTVRLPPGACRGTLFNGGAAASNFYLTVTPSLPGG